MKDQRVDWPSVGQLALAVVSILIFWSGAIASAGWGLVQLVARDPSQGDPVPTLIMASSFAICGILMLPSAYYALFRLMDKPARDSRAILHRMRPDLWILALPPVLLLGYLVAGRPELAWLFLPALNVLAIGIPTIWMLYLTVRGLPTGSSQRMWGVFGSGLTLGPFLILVIEGLAALAFLLVASIWLSTQPGLYNQLLDLYTNPSPEKLFDELGPVLVRPGVLFSILAFGAVVVPIIEELLKPIGVWLLFGRGLTQIAGFTAGALSGAGYALIESLLLSSNGQEWASLVIARSGTSSVHILTTSLMGWAIALAWRKKRYGRLILVFLCAVAIHGLWNGLTLMFSINLLAQMENLPLGMPAFQSIGSIAPIGLVLLTIGCFIGLVYSNRVLRVLKNKRQQSNSIPGEKPVESVL